MINNIFKQYLISFLELFYLKKKTSYTEFIDEPLKLSI